MKDYMMENKAIELVMQDIKEIAPNVPPMVTFGMCTLRRLISDVRDELCGTDLDRLADDLADCMRLTRETFEQIEAAFDLLHEKGVMAHGGDEKCQ